MSQYSGKCDICDHFYMRDYDEAALEKEIKNTDFYIHTPNGRKHKLEINTIKDLIPYYPYLMSVGAFDKSTGHSYIEMSSRSFVDREEEEFLSWSLREALAEYKRCKRKKIPFDVQAYLDKIPKSFVREYDKEIAERVAKDGLKATTKGIFITSKDKWYRNPLARKMSEVGYDDNYINEFIYGWQRILDKTIPNWKEEEKE